jgi:hypothetical protein
MEQRRTRRFRLQLPLLIVRAGTDRVASGGQTRNISSRGVLFTAERRPDLGDPIEYVITLNPDGPKAVSVRCMGNVLRAEPSIPAGDAPAFQVAATLQRYEFFRVPRQNLRRNP